MKSALELLANTKIPHLVGIVGARLTGIEHTSSHGHQLLTFN